MKRLLTILVLLAAGLVTGAAFAGNNGKDAVTTYQTDSHYLPVLVAVDSKGKVTNVDAPIRLKQTEERALDNMIQSMITAPARDKHGNGKASQFLMVFDVQQTDKKNTANFKYVKAKVLQNRKLHWVKVGKGTSHNNTYRLAPEQAGNIADRGAAMAAQNAATYAPSGNSGNSGGDNGN